MRIDLVGSAGDVAEAIEAFPMDYHEDFAAVRKMAIPYLAHGPQRAISEPLAALLRGVLTNWGAGMRAAPLCADAEQIAALLSDADFHAGLSALTRLGVGALGMVDGRPYVHAFDDPRAVAFGADLLLGLLADISRQCLIDNTNVTYPTKTLLLLTGALTALDNKVRAGLTSCGVSGFAATRYLMPGNAGSSGFAKLYGLLFLLGQCWREHAATIAQGVRQTREARLLDELDAPGRVFDILLFSGGGLLRASGTDRGWAKWLFGLD